MTGAGFFIGLLIGSPFGFAICSLLKAGKVEDERILPNLYDQEEYYEDCTVQVLTNTVTGEQSFGWWQGRYEDKVGR